MKSLATLIILLVFFLLIPPWVSAQPYLVEEPDWDSKLTWNLQSNGLIFLGYDLNQNGIPDFFALRIVLRSYHSQASIEDIGKWYPNKLILGVRYTNTNFYYIIEQAPTFYAIDINEDGIWDLMYKDPYHDNVNGNEIFYDSPSGMFGPQIAQFDKLN